MKKLVFLILFSGHFLISAQVVVESPETDALLATQMLLINELAVDSRASETERFIEYLAQFANVISTIKKGQEAAAKVLKIGSELKNRSAEEWLSDVENGLKGTFPEMSDFVSSVKDGAVKNGTAGGKYAEYVAGWSTKMREYHDKLLEITGTTPFFRSFFLQRHNREKILSVPKVRRKSSTGHGLSREWNTK